jgi:signal peptidase I
MRVNLENIQSNSHQYASLVTRIGSIIIDIIFSSCLIIFLNIVFLEFLSLVLSTNNCLLALMFGQIPFQILFYGFYFTWFNANGKQTYGQQLFGIIICDKDFNHVPLLRSFGRTVAFLFDNITVLGNLMLLFNKKKQTFHDLITNTYVVKTDKTIEKNKVLFGILFIIIVLVLSSIGFLKNFNPHYAYKVTTSSMESSLFVGDRIFTVSSFLKKHEAEPGDIVAFLTPKNNLPNIKRFIAMENQTIEIIGKKVYVDGKLFEEPLSVKYISSYILPPSHVDEWHIVPKNLEKRNRDNYGPFIIPKDHIFVLGDNRDNSEDSRYLGAVPKENIVGIGSIVYFSVDKKQKFGNKIRWSRIGRLIR